MIQLTAQFSSLPMDSRSNRAAEGAAVLGSLQASKIFHDYRKAFEATIGLPLVLRAAGSFRTPLQGSRLMNGFCSLMNRTNPTCASCLQLQQRLENGATTKAQTMECLAGLSETLVPVRVGDQVLGYLQTGQIFLRRPSQQRFRALMRTFPGVGSKIAASSWTAAYFQTPVITPRRYEMIIRLLAVFAEHLGTVSNQLLIGRTMAEAPLIARLRHYIAQNHHEPIGLRDAARVVNTSPFHLCKLFKQETGLTFIGYLARVRIETVKSRLLAADVRISEAAYEAGFQSLSQFNRVFHRITGESPSDYRRRLPGVSST